MPSSEEILEKGKSWILSDPDPRTRALAESALSDPVELARLFHNPLKFGTAGLRGPRGAGPGCMNFLVVLRASWAIAQLLKKLNLCHRPLLIGFDARHQAQQFAQAAARLLREQGIKVLLAPSPTPTPLIAFGARTLKASCALVFTASHNPKDDSGMKVYDSDGVQIISPWDRQIEELSQLAPAYLGEDLLARLEAESQQDEVFERLAVDYIAYIRKLSLSFLNSDFSISSTRPESQKSSVAYTPLHGVGGKLTRRIFDELRTPQGNTVQLVSVKSQIEPDPDFPGTPFPNPEIEETLAELRTLMDERGLDAGFAQDPDADRFLLILGLKELTSLSETSCLFSLSGDDLGLLLGHFSLQRQPAKGLLVSSIVSSPAIEAVARLHGGRAERTLTGFKWIARAALSSADFSFGYEEALGYLFSEPKSPEQPKQLALADKDGIAAAAVIGMLLAEKGSQGLLQELFQLQQQVGVWQSVQASIPLDPGFKASELLRRFPHEAQLRREKLSGFVNYSRGAETRSPFLGQQELLSFEVESDKPNQQVTALLRPSGTEPKLKVYVHLRSVQKQKNMQQWLEARQALLLDGQELALQLASSIQSMTT